MIPRCRDESQLKGLDEFIDWAIQTNGRIHLSMAEIGCYIGESTERFLMRPEIDTIICVDIWSDKFYKRHHDYAEDDLKGTNSIESKFDDLLLRYPGRIKKIKDTSVNAAKTVKDLSLDIIYIDAAHDYNSVLEDKNAWFKKTRIGGVFGGHDYIGYIGVYNAVNESFGKPERVFFDSSWAIKV